MKNLKKKGFTIVELVIVIAVIAVLAAVLIPTFSSLIKKANESADIQLVRQMNVILQQDETLNGKPSDTDGVKAVLAANGISNPTPSYAESAFAWDSEENVIILLNKETQKGVFPKEYKDVYFKLTWKMLAGTIDVSVDSLGGSLEQALQNVEFGQTIKLTKDETLGNVSLPKNVSINLDNHKLTLSSGVTLESNGNLTLSNGFVDSGQITLNLGSGLVLNNVVLTNNTGCAIYPQYAAKVEINGGTIISDNPIGTRYSVNNNEDPSIASKNVDIQLNGVTLGSQENPCSVGISMINSGDIIINDCVIYATDKGVFNRAGNMTIKDTTIYYQPSGDYVDTYLGNEGQAYTTQTPTGYKSWHWLGGSSGVSAPIVVGDFRANHYSFDANCTLVNVTVNCTNDTYPDVYLSQENYDVCYYNNSAKYYTGEKVEGPVVCKTTLTCDETITWAVNPGKTDIYKTAEFVANVTSKGLPTEFLDEKYSGYEFSNGGHGGLALLYIDNVFVNGVEQAKGSTSSNQVPAN